MRILDEPTSTASNKEILLIYSRESLEKAYELNVGWTPPLEDQGSDNFLGLIFRQISHGRFPFIEATKIVPFLPDPDLTVKTRDVPGSNNNNSVQEEYLIIPHTERGTKRMWTIVITSLKMATISNRLPPLIATR